MRLFIANSALRGSFSSVAAVVNCFCIIFVVAVIVLGLGGIVSVGCSIVLSKGSKPFM